MTEQTKPKTLIGMQLIVPTKKSERPEIRRLFCWLDDPQQNCPVLGKGQCIHKRWLGPGCVYGTLALQTGWTRRAKRYNAWVREAREKVAAGPKMPKGATQRMAVIGKHVWLPYDYMSMCEAAPFLATSSICSFGNPFIKIEELTPEVVVTLTRFIPRSLSYRPLTVYQEKSVPLFLYDLKHQLPELYQSAADLDSVVTERTPSAEAFRAKEVPISLVRAGITCHLPNGATFVWNSRHIRLKISGEDVTWAWQVGAEKMTDVVLKFTPAPDMTVRVENEEELLRLYQEGAFAA